MTKLQERKLFILETMQRVGRPISMFVPRWTVARGDAEGRGRAARRSRRDLLKAPACSGSPAQDSLRDLHSQVDRGRPLSGGSSRFPLVLQAKEHPAIPPGADMRSDHRSGQARCEANFLRRAAILRLSARLPASASVTRSPPPAARACGWAGGLRSGTR